MQRVSLKLRICLTFDFQTLFLLFLCKFCLLCCHFSSLCFLERFQGCFRARGVPNGTCENKLSAKTHGITLTQISNYYFFSIIYLFIFERILTAQ